jgi:uncharacterized protein (TIGR03118 family)
MNYSSLCLKPNKQMATLLSLSLSLWMTACGGGGGGSSGSSMTGGGSSGGYGSGSSAPAVSITLTGDSLSVGKSTTLSWSATGATSCMASGAWSGAEPASGSITVDPAAAGSYQYTLSCTGSGGTSSKSTTLTVGAAVSGPYSLSSLVADTAGTAALTVDSHLVNPWGIAFAASAPVWVANNGTQTSTLYDGDGKVQPVGAPLIVKLAAGAAGPFAPTGIIANTATATTTDFVLTAGGHSAVASFIYVGESGMLAGWSSSVDPINAVTVYADSGGAEYTAVAMAANAGHNYLYAADFHNGKIDVFDATFKKQTPTAGSFSFADAALPKGYAPFGIQALATGTGGATQIYVAYAQQKAPDDKAANTGAGLGLLDVFDTNGTLVTHLIPVAGALNAPWGIALAPSDFGPLGGELLVANLGDGKINAFDPVTGHLVGPISDSKGNPLSVPGLWGIAFGNDSDNQPHNTLFFAAGTDEGTNGEYGRIDVGAAPPTLSEAPVVTLTAPSASVSGTVMLTAKVTDSVAVSKVQFFANSTTSLGTATAAPFTIQWNTANTSNGSVVLTASATDADANVGKSAPVTVTVNNAPAASTLTQLQATVFGPICSGCHNGVGSSLPGVQNLTSAAATYKALVNVASIEQPTLLRVKPGDPTDSYVIHKLEGAAGITGARMPFGGPYLSQATMDEIESWISAGAADD